VRRGFTLIELLVVIAIIALLLGILLPTLAAGREAARASVCMSNERQAYIAIRAYADENKGLTPALGVPYATLPNWGLVVQTTAGLNGSTSAELFAAGSVLVCPTARGKFGPSMQRTYAINVTGHAGSGTDPDHYDAGAGAAIRLDRADRPSDRPLLVDSRPAPVTPPAPPPTRTVSVIDFRDPVTTDARLSRIHSSGRGWNTGMLDGSARLFTAIPDLWTDPLP